jgi:hypothetical protein
MERMERLGKLKTFVDFTEDRPSGRTMALGFTQPLAKMSTRIFFEGEGDYS